MSVSPGVRSMMNGTLISHPPGGGGSGSSVTNGGPAWIEAIVVRKPMTKKQCVLIIYPASAAFDNAIFDYWT
jgi:hypothetical protein